MYYLCCPTRKDTFLSAGTSQTVVRDFMHYPKGNQHWASTYFLGDFQDPISQLNFLSRIQILALT